MLFLFSLADDPASRGPLRAVLPILRVLRRALRHRLRAARMKGAARGGLGEVGRLAGDRKKRLFAAELWHRAEEGLGIGVFGVAEQIGDGALLDDFPGI